MIDREKFIENFRSFDKEIVLEIIDIFINEYPERMKELKNNVNEEDFDSLRFNAHSMKGVVANFVADKPKTIAKQLEENGKNKIKDGNLDLLRDLKESLDIMIEELGELRKNYI